MKSGLLFFASVALAFGVLRSLLPCGGGQCDIGPADVDASRDTSLVAMLAAVGPGADAGGAAAESGVVSITPKPAAEARDASKPMYSKSAHDITPLTPARIAELATTLSPEDARIILRKGTEAPFCGNLLDNKKEGTYCCKLCGLPLFASQHKFDSGTGWPSFYRPYDLEHIRYVQDGTHGMERIEILCARCDGHLGHVFEDGPKPTGLRYCLNSASMNFVGKDEAFPPASRPVATQTAYFAGGCFWGVEDLFQQTPGVIDSVSGYMGGRTKNPTYKQVCYEDTGHAETVKVVFDPARVSYEQLLSRFFKLHDPTQLNRQGPDVGTQYRSAIFADSPEQLAAARAFIEQQQASNPRFAKKKITTQVATVQEAGTFYVAEEYHQDYHVKHGGHCAVPYEDEEPAPAEKPAGR